jgi:thioredoxin reductase
VEGLSEARPFPPGDYPVLVVGSGPGGLQTSYCLTRLGVEHAVISADERPGGMFQRFPIFQRLLSWTEPDALEDRSTREYEWYDHNSLVADEPVNRALVCQFMDRESIVPTREAMERGLAAFAERTGVKVRYGCRWESTRRVDGGYALSTSEGEYRCRAAVFALGVTDPWKSDIPGIEDVPHYAEASGDKSEYAGRDVLVIGKRNSAFELADGLAPWARKIVLVSPRPVSTSVIALSSVRVRYMQPLEVHQYGGRGGVLALDAAVDRVERTGAGFRLHARGTTTPVELTLDGDLAVAATGFRAPIGDLDKLGVTTVAQGRIPALTPFWESIGAPGIYFAGNATQGAAGLRKHGVGGWSAAVHGFRYNARVLARHLARRLGLQVPTERVRPGEAATYLVRELACAPELWAQKAYLARVVTAEGETEVEPLAHFVDASGPDAVAATIEMNAAGEVYPVVYTRRGAQVEERALPPDLLHDYDREEYERRLSALL